LKVLISAIEVFYGNALIDCKSGLKARIDRWFGYLHKVARTAKGACPRFKRSLRLVETSGYGRAVCVRIPRSWAICPGGRFPSCRA